MKEIWACYLTDASCRTLCVAAGGAASFCTGDLDDEKLVRMPFSILLWEHMKARLPASPLQDEHTAATSQDGTSRPANDSALCCWYAQQLKAHSRDMTVCRSAAREQHTAGPT